MLATGKHARKPATHFCCPKRAQASALVGCIQIFSLGIVFLQNSLHALAFSMSIHPVLFTAIPRYISLARFKARQSCLDIGARIALKRQLSLMIHAAMNRLSVNNAGRSQKQQSECVFHSAIKISNAQKSIRAPASLWRNIFSCAALCGFLLAGGCSDKATEYKGIWKSHCSDYWGVQIKPATGGLYAVTFCGLSGCLPPGEWQPDTLIVNDPAYQIISSDQILIKRGEHASLVYTRCSNDPEWATVSP